MNFQTENSHFLYDAAPSGDEEILLLEEVDFKWLMAGQGWWIDTTRLHSDPSYAARFLRLAKGSPSLALRQCATLLQVQMDRPISCVAR